MTNDPELQARLERLRQRRGATARSGARASAASTGNSRVRHPAARSRRFVLGASALASVGLVATMAACSNDSTSSNAKQTYDSTSSQSSNSATADSQYSSGTPSSPSVGTTYSAPVTSSHAS